MVRHVVLIRFREETAREAQVAVVEALLALPAKIPQIDNLTAGLALGLAPGSSDLAIVADFANQDDYLTYASHPEHRRVIDELLDPWVAERARAQYQLTG
jgi:hypothetical protein